MSNADAYRENITEARAAFQEADARVARLKAAGMIAWGKRTLKSGNEHIGWLVKGPVADAAWYAKRKAEAELMHWQRLLAEELREPAPPPPERTVVVTPDEKTARLREMQEQIAMRLGERPDEDEVPF